MSVSSVQLMLGNIELEKEHCDWLILVTGSPEYISRVVFTSYPIECEGRSGKYSRV